MIQFIKNIFRKKPVEINVRKSDLVHLLPESPVVLEAGVCDGVDTEEFAKVFPTGKIYGFECLPYYYELSANRLREYKNVHLFPYALSDVSGPLHFHISTLNGQFFGSGSILPPKLHKTVHPSIVFDSKIEVQGITIDDWAARHHIDHVDFLWLDLQGAELKALKGAENTLKKVKGIFCEVSLIETYEEVPLYDEVKSFLIDRGFRIEKEFLPYKDMGNVLFLR